MPEHENVCDSLAEMRDKYDRRASDAETENMRHRFEGMRDAYENARKIVRVSGGDFTEL